jgi:glyoxalase family protein
VFLDPQSYHLYYGDELGRPGTILTFFAWPGAYRAPVGPPQVTATSLAVPRNALAFWRERLGEHAVKINPSVARFGDEFLTIADPDGMQLKVMAVENPGGHAWEAGPVPIQHAVRGMHGITVSQEGYENTAKLLTETMGFKAASSDGNRFRYTAGADGFASTVDLLCTPDAPRGDTGAGAVHHVAFRTPDDAQQAAWRAELVRLKFNVSPVMDRSYFHSIYFREPGGVLFEMATDSPGFTADEPAAQLGTKLMLPPQYEPYRPAIEQAVPPVRLPSGGVIGRPSR